jgi:hypothetical protein
VCLKLVWYNNYENPQYFSISVDALGNLWLTTQSTSAGCRQTIPAKIFGVGTGQATTGSPFTGVRYKKTLQVLNPEH